MCWALSAACTTAGHSRVPMLWEIDPFRGLKSGGFGFVLAAKHLRVPWNRALILHVMVG